MSAGTSVRVGADLVEVDRVANSIAQFGDRYVRRIYTQHEIDSCQGSPSVLSAGLAARFAAKEATLKVLRPSGHQPEWRSIEVRRHEEGWCTMLLSGYAAELASWARMGELAVSLTHEGGVAGAVVVAICAEGDPQSSQALGLESNGAL
jgi:holo-[acyl-carrier protein] synthase